jgi:undecaprenyl pyrophosphate phosphatase UppP
MLFINTIYWLWLVIVPVTPASIIGIWIYDRTAKNFPFIILLGVVSIILGITFAERVRKRTGLSTFFGSLNNNPDIKE